MQQVFSEGLQEVEYDLHGLKIRGWHHAGKTQESSAQNSLAQESLAQDSLAQDSLAQEEPPRPRQASAQEQQFLCLHGWLDNANSFLPLAKAFPDNNWQALDLSGHGFSDHKHQGVEVYHFLNWALEIAQILVAYTSRFPKPVTLVGHSMGAAICLLVGALVPSRVTRMVLLDGLAPLTEDASQTLVKAREFFAQHNTPQVIKTHTSFRSLTELRAQVGEMSMNSAALLMQRSSKPVESENRPGPFRTTFDSRLKFTSPMRMSVAQVQSFCCGIECDVTLVDFGMASFGRPALEQELFIKSIRNLRQMTVSGKHHMHMDDPLLLKEAFFNL